MENTDHAVNKKNLYTKNRTLISDITHYYIVLILFSGCGFDK